MYCRAIACDFDGTIAADGHLAPAAAAALERARSLGVATILVTGRVLEDTRARCPDRALFDAIVAENGAVIWLANEDRTITLADSPPERLLAGLRAHGVPFHAGAVVVGTWDRHLDAVAAVIREAAVDAQFILNRSALMILPSGITKATGVVRVLEELRRSPHDLMAFGDAENDLPLLHLAECGIAAAEAVPAVVAAADDHAGPPPGAGVARHIHRVLDAGCSIPTPARHRLLMGETADGAPAYVPAGDTNFMISGDPRSGKSWLAGRVAEELIDRGYQLCIIDPEGDYTGLAERPRVLVLGQDIALPVPTALPRLLRNPSRTLVLTLTSLAPAAQAAFVEATMETIEAERRQRGGVHWTMIDEAQYFLGEGTAATRCLAGGGKFIVVTYRPSLIARVICDAVDAHLITGSAIEEERYFLSSMLRTCTPAEFDVASALAAVVMPRVGLLCRRPSGWQWDTFTPSPRRTVHVHHARKYVDGRLPDSRAFHFLQTGTSSSIVAHDINEFYAALATLPMASWRHHLGNGDFSRWAADVLGNPQLAAGLRKLERTAAAGATVARRDVLARIEDEYHITHTR